LNRLPTVIPHSALPPYTLIPVIGIQYLEVIQYDFSQRTVPLSTALVGKPPLHSLRNFIGLRHNFGDLVTNIPLQ
jgi:hypothetical protein